MKNALLLCAAVSAALVFAACGGNNKCTAQKDCTTAGQTCVNGTCQAGGSGGAGGSVGGSGGSAGGVGGNGGTGGASTGSETCDAPGTLTVGTQVVDTTTGAVDDYTFAVGDGCYDTSAAPDKVFQMTVPANTIATFTVTTGTWDTVLNLVASPATNCTAAGPGAGTGICVGAADSQFADAPEVLSYANTTGAAQTVFLVVDGFAATDVGDFTVDVTTSPVLEGDMCTNVAAAITAASTLSNVSLAGFTSGWDANTNATACDFHAGPDRVWAVTIPAGQRMSVIATQNGLDGGLSNGDIALMAIDAPASNCVEPITCAASTDLGATGEGETLQLTNSTGAARNVLVVLDRWNGAPDPGETYNLAFSFATPPAADVCSTVATPITAATTLATESVETFGDDYSSSTTATGCAFKAGPDHVYEITIPANKQMTVTTTATGAGDMDLSVIDGPAASCSASPVMCVGGSAVTGVTDSVTVNNTAAASTRDVFLVVDRTGTPAAGETYSLGVAFANIPPGEYCGNAKPLTSGVKISGETLVGAARDISIDINNTNCITPGGTTAYSNLGPDKVYSINVNVGQTVTATVTPGTALSDGGVGGAWDVTAYFVAGPATNCLATNTACLALADSAGSGPETVVWTNDGGAPVTAFLVVDKYTASATGVIGVYDVIATTAP